MADADAAGRSAGNRVAAVAASGRWRRAGAARRADRLHGRGRAAGLLEKVMASALRTRSCSRAGARGSCSPRPALAALLQLRHAARARRSWRCAARAALPTCGRSSRSSCAPCAARSPTCGPADTELLLCPRCRAEGGFDRRRMAARRHTARARPSCASRATMRSTVPTRRPVAAATQETAAAAAAPAVVGTPVLTPIAVAGGAVAASPALRAPSPRACRRRTTRPTTTRTLRSCGRLPRRRPCSRSRRR